MSGLITIERYLAWLRLNERLASLYRGHADARWTITPTAFRGAEVPAIKSRPQLLRWSKAAARFASPLPRNAVEWLVLAQHYGIATPLLDWTTNPLTALFFACLDYRKPSDGCVIQCSRQAFLSFNEPSKVDAFRGDRLIPGLIDAVAMNARTLAQDSAMSIHTAEAPTMRIDPAQGEVFPLGKDEKTDAFYALRRFGFSRERLFSDLTTVAEEFKYDLIFDEVVGVPSEADGMDEDSLDLDLRSTFRGTNLPS